MTTPTPALTVETDPAELGFDPDRLDRIDRRIGRYVEDGQLAGWSFLLTRRGQIAHLSTQGRRDAEADLPMDLDTVFRIYSMSKPITSLAAMMLYEQGAFELTDPVSDYLPAFAESRVFTGGSDLKPVTVPMVEPMRVWHLLTHTAGLTYGFHHAHPVDAIYRARGYELGAPPDVDLAGATNAFAAMPLLLFQPGSEWNYSVATDVLGRLVEVLSGMPLDEALRTMIFEPLGMTDTEFGLPDHKLDRLAALYVPAPGGGIARADAAGKGVTSPTWFSGGGGLCSTLGDYHRFTQLLRNNGRLGDVRLVGDRTLRFMASNHLPGGADLESFGRPLFAETPFTGTGFGLGFSVTLDPLAGHSMSSAGEYGWGGAASTAFWIDPVEDITAVFMTQLLPSSTYPIRSQLRQLVYSALVDPATDRR
ncbi:serine hydrolase domain-containing protein [uncultured Jatrophihabitans sp.]|uniref:serine hydrolase domain-containing protein n=1 Tax=uncultured Jatrophihabitans sp. TaxID=1610747 RepID=UPI0035C9C92D